MLGIVPRHEKIVAAILDNQHAHTLTVAIGVCEILMGIWVLSGIKSNLNAIVQIVVIATMNLIEFIMAPKLLLFGRFNLVLALLLIAVIWYKQFVLKKQLVRT